MPLFIPSINYIGSMAYASLPTAAVAGACAVAFASDLGVNGSWIESTGTRWRPLNGRASLKALTTQVTGLTNSEAISLQTLLPTNSWQIGDTLRIWMAITKSGSTDNANVTIRIGTAGTTGDTAITGISANTVLGASNLAGGFIYDIQLVSATSAQKVGLGSGTNGSYTGAANAAIVAATTITSAATNPLFVSFAALSSSTNNTVGIQSAQIELITT